MPPHFDEQVEWKRGLPKGSKNALKQQAIENIADTIWMSQKEELDIVLSLNESRKEN